MAIGNASACFGRLGGVYANLDTRADPERQEEYKKNSVDEHGGEGRVVSGRSAFPAVRFPLSEPKIRLHHPGRASVGYFGAVRLRDGKFVYQRETGRFNGESLRLLEATAADHFPFPSSWPTTPAIITPNCTSPGERGPARDSPSITYRLTAPT